MYLNTFASFDWLILLGELNCSWSRPSQIGIESKYDYTQHSKPAFKLCSLGGSNFIQWKWNCLQRQWNSTFIPPKKKKKTEQRKKTSQTFDLNNSTIIIRWELHIKFISKYWCNMKPSATNLQIDYTKSSFMIYETR